MIIGTVVNTVAIIAGSSAGLLFGKKIDEGKKKALLNTIGLAVTVIGLQMALTPHNFLYVLISLLIGMMIGEFLGIEDRFESLGEWLQVKTGSETSNFVSGFVSASSLFTIGAMSIIGSLKDGLYDDPSLLYVKSTLDMVVAMVLTSKLGIGVIFSAFIVLVYQGSLSLAASRLSFLMDNQIYTDGISATGGIIIVAIGLKLLGVLSIKISNMLPSLVIIVLLNALL